MKISTDRIMFAPGCALMLYKPALAARLLEFLRYLYGNVEQLDICCHHDPNFSSETTVINVCPGCDKRFMNDYTNSKTVSLWEILATSENFPFPDYRGISMSVADACPTRDRKEVHRSVRVLLNKMNISVIEAERTGTGSICCGDSFFGVIPVEKVMAQMKKRAAEMPAGDVAVYCVSCVKSMYIGNKKPHYIPDLLFNEETDPGIFDPEKWHRMIDEYIEKH